MLSLTSLSRGGGLLPRFSSYVVWTTKKVCFSSQPLLEKGKLQAFDEAIMFLQSQGIPPSQLSEKVSFHNGQVDFSKPGFQKLGLQHFIQHRREHLMLFAKQRHVFKDFFPTADLNAEVHLATSHNERIDFCSECPPLKVRNEGLMLFNSRSLVLHT
ncbi:hypothetical protein HMI54_014870 [Coelomomyces lativittatus]|nr:hypothetical protein HMI54_014870 [Coelomomyces lativittatus]